MNQKSRHLALCGVLCALSVVFLLLGSIVPLATFCCPILAMFALLPVLEESGGRMALLAYGAVSLLSLLLVPDKEISFLYVFLGYYPILRPKLNRLPRLPRLALKLGLFNLSMVAMYALLLFVFQLNTLTEEFTGATAALLALFLLSGNITFGLLDLALDRIGRLYHFRLRKLFRKR